MQHDATRKSLIIKALLIVVRIMPIMLNSPLCGYRERNLLIFLESSPQLTAQRENTPPPGGGPAGGGRWRNPT